MKKLKKMISMIVCAIMLINFLPQIVLAVNNDNGTCTISTGTIYVLVEEKTVNFTIPDFNQTQNNPDRGETTQVKVPDLKNGGKYLIVATKGTGTQQAARDNNGLTAVQVQVNPADASVPRQYISNRGNATVWTATAVSNSGNSHDANREENDWRFSSSNNRYLNGNSINNSGTQMSVRDHYLSWYYAQTFLRYNNGWTSTSSSYPYGPPPSNATQIYFYEETSVTSTYSISANDLHLSVGETFSTTNIVKQLKANGNNIDDNSFNNGRYSYELREGSDIVSLSNDGILTAKKSGYATVRVTYSWGGNGNNRPNEVWTDINVIVGVPHYDVDILEGGTSKSIIAKKNVSEGDTTDLSAVVFSGSYVETDAVVSWTATNDSIGAVTQNADGTATFTFNGDEGSTVLLATYTYTNDNGEEITVTDQVTITASKSDTIFPSDGTDDFPEYPDEGSVRLDKTGTAVGNFNQTGLVQVELSMTGVPFKTNAGLDVVLMLDESNSMTKERLAATKEATELFLESLVFNDDGSFTGNRIFVGSFQGGNPEYAGQTQHAFHIHYITNNGQNYQIVTSQEEYQALIDEVYEVLEKDVGNVAYGTEYAKSLQFCYEMLNNSKADGNKQFCVFMSDGIPNVYHGENGAVVNSSSEMANMFRGTNYNTRDTDYQYEKYSTAMKNNGVTVFSVGLGLKSTNSSLGNASAVQCENVANILLNDISGPAYEPAANRDTGTNISKLNEYFFSVEDADAASGMSTVFETIAQRILDAARDVKVTDQITDDYTMVFEPPSDYIDDAMGTNADNRFYIDVLNYELIPQYENGQIVDYNRSGTPTEVMKLYMGKNADGSYFAAKEDGSAYNAPQFAQTPLGTKYYWTTANITGSESYSGVSVTAGGKTYYFDTNGVYADSGTDLSTWYNMVSGAYAHGTPETIEGSSDDKDATVYRDLVIATPYFVYNASTRQLLWTLDKLDNKEIALRYFLYLDGAATEPDKEPQPGTYPTNVEATLSYTNFQNNKAQQWYPEPQMTWHGAQVTYVFYLVNEQGQPVNRAGRVVPMSEAVYVTDQHTISVVWTGLEKQKSLGANLLAQDIVPSVYQLYDTTAAYSVHAFENETEMKQHNHFRIDGDTGTTYVFNSKSDATKYHTSGIYAEYAQIMCKDYEGVTKKVLENGKIEWSYTGDGTQYKENNNPIYGTDDTGHYTIVYEQSDYRVEEGFNFYDTTVAFAVKWIPALAPDEVVIDYGLDVLVDITTNDLSVAEPVGLMAVAPSGVTENTGHILDLDRSNVFQSLEFKNGDQLLAKASLEGYNVRFHLDRSNGMQLTDDFTFYYVSQVSYYSENVLMKEYMYTHVRIIPATTMYYEEDYITTSTSGWSTIGSPSSSVQDVDRPGFNSISETNDANNVYGYDGHYTNCPNYSLNSTKLGQVGDKATFTFNGTGYDLIGRTDQQTACILVSMTQAGSTGNYTFTGTFVRDGEKVTATGDTIFVDTYYESNNGVAAIPQVPVITVRDLPYGTYTVTVEVVRTQEADSDFYHESTDRFYFDALRIYDPIDIRGYSDSVGKVYVMDNEWSPDYEEFRNEILKVYGNSAFDGSTFIDREGTITDIALYNIWGPNNEFYLAPGETIRLNVDPTYLKTVLNNADSRGMADMQLGIKLVSGGSSKVTISNTTNSRTYDITSTSDLNFSIKDMYSGTLVISNTGGGVVSLNTMKVTLLPPQVTTTFALRRSANPGVNNQPGYVEPPANQTTEMPASPNSVISDAILDFKEAFAAVIIAVANAMDGFSKWLQDVANALFS